jgi:hypothetical protein
MKGSTQGQVGENRNGGKERRITAAGYKERANWGEFRRSDNKIKN